MYICMNIHMYACVYVCTYVCTYLGMYVCMYAYTLIFPPVVICCLIAYSEKCTRCQKNKL